MYVGYFQHNESIPQKLLKSEICILSRIMYMLLIKYIMEVNKYVVLNC